MIECSITCLKRIKIYLRSQCLQLMFPYKDIVKSYVNQKSKCKITNLDKHYIIIQTCVYYK